MKYAPKHPVPIFPLPDVLLFPGVAIPLHVFELRYRTMVRDALSSERMIVLAVLEPGWERDYHGSPAFHPLGCLARFENVTWLPDDRYDLELRGLARVQIGAPVREFPYRACRVTPCPQDPLSEDDPLVQLERSALIDAYTRFTRAVVAADINQELPVMSTPVPLNMDLDFETLVNTLCLMCNTGTRRMMSLLEHDSLIDRSRRLRECMEELVRAPRRRQPGSGESN